MRRRRRKMSLGSHSHAQQSLDVCLLEQCAPADDSIETLPSHCQRKNMVMLVLDLFPCPGVLVYRLQETCDDMDSQGESMNCKPVDNSDYLSIKSVLDIDYFYRS